MNTEIVITFDGYLAELIKIVAEREKKTPEEYILSLFDVRCNAPEALEGVRA